MIIVGTRGRLIPKCYHSFGYVSTSTNNSEKYYLLATNKYLQAKFVDKLNHEKNKSFLFIFPK